MSIAHALSAEYCWRRWQALCISSVACRLNPGRRFSAQHGDKGSLRKGRWDRRQWARRPQGCGSWTKREMDRVHDARISYTVSGVRHFQIGFLFEPSGSQYCWVLTTIRSLKGLAGKKWLWSENSRQSPQLLRGIRKGRHGLSFTGAAALLTGRASMSTHIRCGEIRLKVSSRIYGFICATGPYRNCGGQRVLGSTFWGTNVRWSSHDAVQSCFPEFIRSNIVGHPLLGTRGCGLVKSDHLEQYPICFPPVSSHKPQFSADS